ncbi:hypothetical protein [Arcticibacter eurypsychrophilus]|uniref:hypothetical protein n=1 Tax=Arcticibacter eurypsychrophilus TaxID=1434752 RepID=UPI00084D6837|nr:hypothetical protein [Arcticibacter eurypsychrophilus]
MIIEEKIIRPISLKVSAIFIAHIGLLTLFLTTSILFDLFGIRAYEGNYIAFVVWANFACGFIYLFAAYGFIMKRKWTAAILGLSALILIVAFIGLYLHINSGGRYETKTISAMLFRITVTLVFAILAYFTITKKKI